MRTLTLTHKISGEELKLKIKTAKTISDYRRWQVIYMVSQYRFDAAYIANLTGYSKANIYSIVRQFNKKQGDVSTKARGGRRRELMTLAEEQAMMKGLEDKAIKGQILSYKDIKKIVENKVGKKVSDDYIWDLFKRNGWTKHSPRPQHPKKDQEKQEAFKKNSKTIWLPLRMILTPG